MDTRKGSGALIVKADTSLIGTGATVWQYRSKAIVLVRIYSRALNSAQINYSATEREALGFVFAVERFAKILRNKHFFGITDHKSLLAIFGISAQTTKNYKLVRLKWRLSQYTFSMIHVNGNSLEIAMEDFLSRYSTEIDRAKEFREKGLQIKLDSNGKVINPYRDTLGDVNKINVINARNDILIDLDLELLEVVGYINKNELKFDVQRDRVDIAFTDTNLMEYLDSSQEYVVYQIDKEQNDENKIDLKDNNIKQQQNNKMIYFREACDISNYVKNVRLNRPFAGNVNISIYDEKNKYGSIQNVNDLRDILLIKSMIQNIANIKDPNVLLKSSVEYQNNMICNKNDVQCLKDEIKIGTNNTIKSIFFFFFFFLQILHNQIYLNIARKQ